ncbi:MAG: hypothetical protein GEU82_12495 [Luteitalea sp.]|nr:hypothetical protein [Luteitalea sp.]
MSLAMIMDGAGEPIDRPGTGRSRAAVLAALGSHMALSAAIYWPTLHLAFVSETWTYLARLRVGIWPTLTTSIGYNYQPVAIAWIALIRACFGENAAAFQAVNIAQVGLLGHLTYQLGRRLLPDARSAWLGGLLVIGNAAFYEASYWPLAGNMHLLGAILYVLAVIVSCDAARGRFGAGGSWLLALIVLAAIFTHPAMVTAVPVCALTLFLAGGRLEERPADALARKLKMLLPLVGVVVLFGISRLVFATAIASGPQPGLDSMRAYWLVSRGLVAVFSLRGSHDVVHGLMTFGTNVGFDTVQVWVFVAGWLVVAGAAAAICLWRARTPGLRVLIAFLAIHLVAVAIASAMSSRESHVPAVPAALLTAWALHIAAGRLAARVSTAQSRLVCRQLPAVGILLLIAWAQRDHATSAEVHIRAANLSRTLVELVKVQSPPGFGPLDLTLINMPAYTIERGIGAITFANGLEALARIAAPGLASIQLVRIPIPSAPADFANRTVPIELEALRAQVLDPSRVVVLFEKPTTLTALSPEILDRLASR